jgi:ABC-type branched-subunit amino acid transport system substrate-binding protein
LPAAVREKNTLKVAILIPLMLSENKLLNHDIWGIQGENPVAEESLPSDTLRNNLNLSAQLQFHGNSENFLHFYEGALLAVDSLEQAGIRVELEVWDTEQKSSKVKNFISSGVLNNADLIIGPVYPNELKEIGDFAAKHKIPVVSPLSSSEEYTRENEYFFQINPSREFATVKTREYVVSAYRNCNIIVIQTSNSGNEAENEAAALRKALAEEAGNGKTTIRTCNFRKDGYAGLRTMMVKEKKNVLVLPTVNEAEVSVVVSNMKNLSSEFDVVVIGNSRFPQFESIDPEHYHLSALEFLTPYWPDMNQQVPRSFVHNFRHYFRSDPNQYSIQGYDVTYFFVKALSDYGPGFAKCLANEKISLVQGTYRFHKFSSGGYINQGLSVVQYLPSFEIIRKMVIAE